MDAVRKGLVAEAPEHGRVDNAETLRPFGPIDLLRDIGHVERDAVAGLETQRAQGQGAFRALQQQALAGDRIGVHGAAPAGVRGQVPAVTLEDQRGLRAPPRQNVTVHLIEGGVGQAPLEPAPVWGLVGVEGPCPGLKGFRQVQVDDGAARGVPPAPETRGVVILHPGLAAGAIVHKPMHHSLGAIAVKFSGRSLAGRPHTLPVRAGADAVSDRRRLNGQEIFPIIAVHSPECRVFRFSGSLVRCA